MRLPLTIAALALLASSPCLAQSSWPTPANTSAVTGTVPMVVNPSGQAVPASTGVPLPVTGGIVTGIPGSPANAQTGPNVVTMQGVNGMVPIAVLSGQCPPNPISKIAAAWPFCK